MVCTWIIQHSLSANGGLDAVLTSYILLNQGHWSRIQPFSRNWRLKNQSPPWCFCVAHMCSSALALVSSTLTPDFRPLKLRWYCCLLSQHICGAVLEQSLRTKVRRENEALLCGVRIGVLLRWLLHHKTEVSHQLALCRRRGGVLPPPLHVCWACRCVCAWSPWETEKKTGLECLVAQLAWQKKREGEGRRRAKGWRRERGWGEGKGRGRGRRRESSSILLSNNGNSRTCLSLVAFNWGALRAGKWGLSDA